MSSKNTIPSFFHACYVLLKNYIKNELLCEETRKPKKSRYATANFSRR